MFWFWFFVGPAILLAIAALRGERERARFVAEHLVADGDAGLPPATVVVTLDGSAANLREKLAQLSALDYPDYQLILTAGSAAEIPAGTLPPSITVVLGGVKHASERAQNLARGVRAARKRSEVFAFASGRGHISRNWLRDLARPLANAGVGASTGYVWYTPEPPAFWSLMRSVWSAPIAGLLGPGDSPFAWDGAMAIGKQTFFELRIAEEWQRAGDTGLALARAVHAAGFNVAFAPGAMTACTGHTGAREFLGQARSEMALARVCLPRLWRGALIAHFFYCGGMAAAVTASVYGNRGAEWALVVQLGLGMLKGVNRAALAKAELPDREAWFKRHAWVHALWVPLATWIWLGILAASAFSRPNRSASQV